MEQNSERYWDERFSLEWEASGGRVQTAYFAKLIIDALPDEISEEIAVGKSRIIDFGCAMGDCADALKKRFPECNVGGMDFSNAAIERARVLFPECDFVHGDMHICPVACDVAVCSNVLEHLSDPRKTLGHLFAVASRYVIVMVPYEEDYIVAEHIYSFTPRFFPLEASGFTLEHMERVDSENKQLWAGSQLLVVYKKYRSDEQRTETSRSAMLLQRQWTDPLDIVARHSIKNGALVTNVRSALDSLYAGMESRCAGLENQLLNIANIQKELSKRSEERIDSLGQMAFNMSQRLDSGFQSFADMSQRLDSGLQSLADMSQRLDSGLQNLVDMSQRLEVINQRLDNVSKSVDSMASEQYRYVNTILWELRQFVCQWNRGILKNFLLSIPVLGGALRRCKSVVGRIRADGFNKTWEFYKMKYLGAKPVPPVVALIRDERKKRKGCKGVYVLPTIPWDVPIFQRPQQMAIALAQKGYLVIYLEHIHNHPAGTVREVRDGLFVVTVGDYGAAIQDLSGCIISMYSTATCFAEQNIVTPQLAKCNTLVYEYIDHFDEKISGPGTADLVAFYNRIVSGEVPIKYLASARILQSELERRTGKKVAYVANGVDVSHFSTSNIQEILKRVELPASLKSTKPKIGYFGALAPWLDYEMIGAVVRMHPEWEFIFIGPDYYGGSNQLPMDQANCHWLGPIDYTDLPAYAAAFDVAILPFRSGDLAKSTSPLKLFEYFALGKPVVVTPDMEECKVYSEVIVGGGAEGFSNAIAEAVVKAGDPELVKSLHKLALENSWEARAQAFIEETCL